MSTDPDTVRTTDSYTLTEIAELLGESRAKIYRWVKAFEHTEQFIASAKEEDGGKYYPRSQWTALLESVGRKLPEPVRVEVEQAPDPIGFNGLVAPSGPSSLSVAGFDMDGYKNHRSRLEQQTASRAKMLDDAVTNYARSRIAETLADIDVAAAQMRDNAFRAMGMREGSEAEGRDK